MAFELSSILLVLFGLSLCIVTICIIRSSSLLNAIIFTSASSLLITLCYLFMDAPDVAMTEAALGACLSTVVLLSFARKLAPQEAKVLKIRNKGIAITFCILLAMIMIYAGLDLANYGDSSAGSLQHINQYFLANTSRDIGVPSFVAAILASYRGYDTLGETAVIFTAVMAVLMIFGRSKNE